jgi:hypothetical protein
VCRVCCVRVRVAVVVLFGTPHHHHTRFARILPFGSDLDLAAKKIASLQLFKSCNIQVLPPLSPIVDLLTSLTSLTALTSLTSLRTLRWRLPSGRPTARALDCLDVACEILSFLEPRALLPAILSRRSFREAARRATGQGEVCSSVNHFASSAALAQSAVRRGGGTLPLPARGAARPLAVLAWLRLGNNPPCYRDCGACCEAALGVHLHVLKWMRLENNPTLPALPVGSQELLSCCQRGTRTRAEMALAGERSLRPMGE